MRQNAYVARRMLAIGCMALVIMSQLLLVMPMQSYAITSGDVLIVRVQYYGESGSKIREKAKFTRAELEAMGNEKYYYSNITSVGTVMSLAARGPKVTTILDRAGIDLDSIQSLTFRTSDGYTRNFTVQSHLTATKYYYPNLSTYYERDSETESMTLPKEALRDRTAVPAILALECGDSKKKGTKAQDLTLTTNKAYRFCMGQSYLEEGLVDLNGEVVTSIDSCHSIYGIDVTLYGSPPDEEGETDDVSSDDKVGSKKKSIKDNKEELVTESQQVEAAEIKMREIQVGDRIVKKVSPQERLRNNMADDANELTAVRQYSRGAAIATGVGAGLLFSIGAITRLLRYMKWR